MERTYEDWEDAYSHAIATFDMYNTMGMAGIANTLIQPLLLRYEQGERDELLYDLLLAIE